MFWIENSLRLIYSLINLFTLEFTSYLHFTLATHKYCEVDSSHFKPLSPPDFKNPSNKQSTAINPKYVATHAPTKLIFHLKQKSPSLPRTMNKQKNSTSLVQSPRSQTRTHGGRKNTEYRRRRAKTWSKRGLKSRGRGRAEASKESEKKWPRYNSAGGGGSFVPGRD